MNIPLKSWQALKDAFHTIDMEINPPPVFKRPLPENQDKWDKDSELARLLETRYKG